MKKKVKIKSYIVIGIIAIFTIIMSSLYMIRNKKSEPNKEIVTAIETTNIESSTEKLEGEVDTSKWDLTKVKIEYDTENVPVPVPIGFTASKAEGEHTVNTGFVIYEGEVTETEVANKNAWTEEEAWQLSLDKNQFVWIPVQDSSRIYEKNITTGMIKAKLWNFTASGRNIMSNADTDIRIEPGILGKKSMQILDSLAKVICKVILKNYYLKK